MIGRAMKTWPSDALRRVVDAPVEEWRQSWDGCLACHVSGGSPMAFAKTRESFADLPLTTEPDRYAFHLWTMFGLSAGSHPIFGGSGRYVRAITRFGIPRVVRAIKQRALRILESRDATMGERVRVEAA